MDDLTFEKLVGQAIDLLPKEFAERLNNVAVTFQDFPTDYQVRKARLSRSSLLFGLYEGVPQTKRGIYYSAVPDKITIFKNSILQVSQTEQEVQEKVRQVVIHEIGHHFGLSDADMKK
jgi:predicted Zn-dependent protease with MMP-like domain